MKVFWTAVCILGCILFTLMSACFGYFSIFFLGDFRDEPHAFALMLGAAVLLAGIAFLLGSTARKRLRAQAAPAVRAKGE
jgi:hypothetical protein